jgi:dihydrofolate reductase
MQGLGGADEDRSGGFERGGWALPLLDEEGGTFVNEVFQRADAFLFGRRTYEIWAPYWGAIADPGNPIAAALNARPKYVASTTLTDPQWPATTVLSGDVAAAVGELKAEPGGELQVHGSGKLVRWLFENQLVDEITLLTYPLVIGQGTRLFPDTGPDTALELLDSRSTPTGVSNARHARSADAAGGAGLASRGAREDQPRDRRSALHQPEHGRVPPAEGVPQAGREVTHATCEARLVGDRR